MKTRSAFTLVELCCATAAALLVGLTAASPFRASPAAEVACLNNQRQLIRAWQLYADDHGGRFAGNYHGGDIMQQLPGRISPWASGWLTWSTDPANTNRLHVTSPRFSRLANFLNPQRNAAKCPSDIYVSRQQRARGWKERVRSYSMNLIAGHEFAASNPGPLGANYAIALTMADLVIPGPVQTIIFVEEHPDSINDPAFFPPESAISWIDIPSALHGNAANHAFADGHAELRRWRGSGRNPSVHYNFTGFAIPRSKDPDTLWFALHSARRTDRAF